MGFESFASLYRVKDWVHYLGFILLGLSLIEKLELHLIIFYFLLTSFLLAYIYSFNNGHRRKFSILPFIFIIAFYFILEPLQKIFCLIFVLLFTFYSWEKVGFFKSVPILSVVSNAFGFPLLFLIPTLYDLNPKVIWFFSLFVLLSASAQIIHEIVHFEIDKREKIKTTTVYFGKKRMVKFYRFSLLLSIAVSLLIFCIYHLFLQFLSTLAFCLYFIFLPSSQVMEKETRRNFKNLGILLGVVYLISILCNL